MKRRAHASGQILLTAIFIGLLIILVVPVIILINQMGSHQQVSSAHANKARNTAVTGIAYAVQQLQLGTAWTDALKGNFAASTGCNAGVVTTASGEPFTLACDHGSGRPYQVHILATSHAQDDSHQASGRSVEAYVSQRTVGVKLANGYTASAAMLLVNTPAGVVDNSLVVHWGPVVCLSSATNQPWILADPMNGQSPSGTRVPGYPRKFSLGGITGLNALAGDRLYRAPTWTATDLTSDQKEYWAFAAQTFAPVLDDAAYQAAAKANPAAYTATLQSGGTVTGSEGPNPGTGYYYSVVGDTVIFDSTFQPAVGAIIYVDGNAKLLNSQVNLSTGALIVTGNLVLGTVTALDGLTGVVSLNVPPTAALEYPYYGSGDAWPCKAYVGQTCTVGTNTIGLFNTANRLNFRGFIWAQGGLQVSAGNSWNTAGVMVVGDPITQSGQFLLQTGAALTLAYDDTINHSIITRTVELQSDSLPPGP